MKKFLSGFLSCAIIMTLALSIMAITGKTTIDVYPIDIMVNGEVFQPTNAQGKPVDVFTYKGTTYAPLRALAVAYGLEVGYDAEKKLATVSEPAKATGTPDGESAEPGFLMPESEYSSWSAEKEAEYQEFKAMWEIEITETNGGLPFDVADIICKQSNIDALKAFIDIHQPSEIDDYSIKLVYEIVQTTPNTRAIFKVKTEKNCDVLWHCYPEEVTWYCGYSKAVEYVAETLSKSGM